MEISEIKISHRDSHYQLILVKNIINTNFYTRFINWVSGEFDLLLKEESLDLQVYYPNGNFIIKNMIESKEPLSIEIIVKNKSKDNCMKMAYLLLSIYNNLENYYALKK